jgi:hypothetical protein
MNPSLKRYFNSSALEFDITFWNLMDNCKATPGDEGIVLSSYILGDGHGDWAHLEKEAKELSKKFPERQITVIAIAAERHRGKLKPKEIGNVSHYIGYCHDSVHCTPIIKDSPFDDHESILNTIKNAAAWLAGPIAIEGIFNDLKNESIMFQKMTLPFDLSIGLSTLLFIKVEKVR